MKPGWESHKDQLTSPLIVKLGGSLFNQIADLAPILNASTRPLFIIPGGGPFADLVRQIRVNNDAAHWMAIAAMEQYGWFISSFGILTTEKMSMAATTTVLLPYRYFMHERHPAPYMGCDF